MRFVIRAVDRVACLERVWWITEPNSGPEAYGELLLLFETIFAKEAKNCRGC